MLWHLLIPINQYLLFPFLPNSNFEYYRLCPQIIITNYCFQFHFHFSRLCDYSTCDLKTYYGHLFLICQEQFNFETNPRFSYYVVQIY
jgi:hypothetical protein